MPIENVKISKGRKLNTGFTLVEILITIAVLTILAIAGVVAFSRYQSHARDAQRIADIKTIQSAIELYIQSQPKKLPPGVSDIGDPMYTFDWDCSSPYHDTCLSEVLANYLENEFLPKDPLNYDGYSYMYCRLDNNYFLATVLENRRELQGEYDNFTAVGNPLSWVCIISDATQPVVLDCSDDAGEYGGQLGTIYGSVFCSGFWPEPIVFPEE